MQEENIDYEVLTDYINWYGSHVNFNDFHLNMNHISDGLMQMFYAALNNPCFPLSMPYGTILSQANNIYSYLFRGEYKNYNTTTPNIYRINCADKNELKAHKFFHLIKIEEFKYFMSRLNIIKDWNYLCYYEAIAQHYGFKTELLDLTNNFKIALFFACCKFDDSLNSYRPLSESEINEYKTGSIYVISKSLYHQLESTDKNIDKIYDIPLPIGFQPMLRCHRQYGWVLKMDESSSLQKSDSLIKKLIFNHSLKLSEWIFEEMDNGKKLMPDENLKPLELWLDKIKNNNLISNNSLKTVLLNYPKENIHTIKQLLIKYYDVKFVDKSLILEQDDIDFLNIKIEEYEMIKEI